MQNTIEKINHMIDNYKLDNPAKNAEIMVTSTDLLIDINQLLGHVTMSHNFVSDHIQFLTVEKLCEMIEHIEDKDKVKNKWRVVKSLIVGFYNDYV